LRFATTPAVNGASGLLLGGRLQLPPVGAGVGVGVGLGFGVGVGDAFGRMMGIASGAGAAFVGVGWETGEVQCPGETC
jgi:hypothetical protein